MTAISQVWEQMGSFGQVSITALTRRHGYLRGHGMGATGPHPDRAGARIWFCTRDNQVIERKVRSLFVRRPDTPEQPDYSIILFDADLPAGIEPLRVADMVKLIPKYFAAARNRKPIFMPLQRGFVSAGVPGWTVPFGPGDSGAPLLLPLPDELVFLSGVTTSGPSAGMQADMDLLSREAGLDPRKYQMQWLNLDKYPNP